MKKSAAIADAIRVMTAWASEPSGGNFANSQIEGIITERDEEGLFDLLHGLISLSGVLLVRCEKETGIVPLETLQQIAAKYTNREDDG